MQTLCRTSKTGKYTGLVALGCATVLLAAVWRQADAQNAPVSSPGWPSLELGARQFVMDTYKLESPLVSILPMDSRIKIQTCDQDIVFDQPYGNKQSVRARCAQPVWQHFVMVQIKTGIGAQLATATQTNTVVKQVWVSTQPIKRGSMVLPGMFKTTEISVPAHETRFVSDERELLNTELLRDLPVNTPVKTQDLKQAAMVKREAQQDGLLGEQIRLKNPESGRSLTAVVTGLNMAKGL